jgi:hypothetical protein
MARPSGEIVKRFNYFLLLQEWSKNPKHGTRMGIW